MFALLGAKQKCKRRGLLSLKATVVTWFARRHFQILKWELWRVQCTWDEAVRRNVNSNLVSQQRKSETPTENTSLNMTYARYFTENKHIWRQFVDWLVR